MKSEKGFSLLEVMIALLLLGIIAAAFLGALSTGSRALFIADERATAESLARTQMEYVKEQDYRASEYIPGPPPQWIDKSYLKIDDSQIPDGYTILGFDRNNDEVEDIIGVPWNSQLIPPLEGQAVSTDAGLQRVELRIYHLVGGEAKHVLTLVDYKVNR